MEDVLSISDDRDKIIMTVNKVIDEIKGLKEDCSGQAKL